jgi:hypothetical protein
MGVKLFKDFRQRLVEVMALEQDQQSTADEGQIGQEVWVAAAGTVLPQDGIASPVIADFDSSPVPANVFKPLGGPILLRHRAGEIIMGFGGREAGLFNRASIAHDNQSAREGEVGRQWLDGKGVEGAGVDASVSGLTEDKKGVSLRASKAWACLKSLGWLALICRRYSPPFSTMSRAVWR